MNEEEQLKNYFDMADVAFKAGNYRESYQWCNKILELNSNIGLAAALQGKSILFMSTAQDLHFDEAYTYYETAFNLISENLTQDNSFLKNESAEFVENFNVIVARDFSTKFLELYGEIKNNTNNENKEEIFLSCEFLSIAFFKYVLARDPKIEYAKNFVDICRDIFKADKLNEITAVSDMIYQHKDAAAKYMMTLNFAENILKDDNPQYKSIMEERTYSLLISLDKELRSPDIPNNIYKSIVPPDLDTLDNFSSGQKVLGFLFGGGIIFYGIEVLLNTIYTMSGVGSILFGTGCCMAVFKNSLLRTLGKILFLVGGGLFIIDYLMYGFSVPDPF